MPRPPRQPISSIRVIAAIILRASLSSLSPPTLSGYATAICLIEERVRLEASEAAQLQLYVAPAFTIVDITIASSIDSSRRFIYICMSTGQLVTADTLRHCVERLQLPPFLKSYGPRLFECPAGISRPRPITALRASQLAEVVGRVYRQAIIRHRF